MAQRVRERKFDIIKSSFFGRETEGRNSPCGCLIGAVAASIFPPDAPLFYEKSLLDYLLSQFYEGRMLTEVDGQLDTTPDADDLVEDFESFKKFMFNQMGEDVVESDEAKREETLQALHKSLPELIERLIKLRHAVEQREDFKCWKKGRETRPFYRGEISEIAAWFDGIYFPGKTREVMRDTTAEILDQLEKTV